MPQPLKEMGGGDGTLLIRHQTHTLLHARPGGVVLKVEQVLLHALEVGHGLNVLLPYGVLLILNR
jgi:hypothetical protein